MTRRDGGRIAAVLLLLATAAFAVGAVIENAENAEGGSTPAIAVGLVLSLVVVGALLTPATRRRALEAAAVFCVGFAVLDAIEVTRKVGEGPQPPSSPAPPQSAISPPAQCCC